jgi:putative FmdB family regulatory protein
MPIYEYNCPSCGVVEALQGIKEAPLTRCPSCKKCKVKKLISESSFQLKGSGWYATDYAHKGNGGNGKKHKEDKSAETAASTSTETKDTSTKEPAKETAKESGKESAKEKGPAKDATASSA